MALTRKFLTAMGIEAEKVDEIITAHTETVDALKEQISDLKAKSGDTKDLEDSLKTTQDELSKANEKIQEIENANWEKKYNDLKSEYDNFKTDTEAKAVKAKKVSAYRNILKKAGVSENRIDTVLKVSDQVISGIDFDGDDVKDAEKLEASVKEEWADFIGTTHEKGADVSKPPANNGGEMKKPSMAAQLAAQYRNEHYGNPIKED